MQNTAVPPTGKVACMVQARGSNKIGIGWNDHSKMRKNVNLMI